MLTFPFQKLEIWQKSLQLTQAVYVLTPDFPRSEIFGLTSQMRRAAVSISSNIAEGSQRGSNKEFLHFISISRGSLAELETHIIVAKEIGYISNLSFEETLPRVREIARMINAFAKRLATSH